MKLVTAIVQTDIVDSVREALLEAEVTRITVSRCTGRGKAGEIDLYRGQKIAPTMIPKVRIDIACNDEFVEITIDAIFKGARHNGGEVGDGKIFVTALEECIRIRTGERGTGAI